MTWNQLLKQLMTRLESHPNLMEQSAMIQTHEGLFELDLYRSLSTGRLLITIAYKGKEEDDATD